MRHRTRLRTSCLAIAALSFVVAQAAWGQVVRLPPTDVTEPLYVGQLLSHQNEDVVSFDDCGTGFDDCGGVQRLPSIATLDEEPLPPEHRSGFFQKVLFDYTYLPRFNPQGMGLNTAETKLVLAVPFPTVEWPLLIVPSYSVHFTDGPRDVEMPPRLHEAFLGFRWLPKLSPTLSLDVTVAPGLYSDFEQSSDDAFRIPGYAAAAWACRPTVKLVLGVGYFDRLTVDWLPVGGIIWTPTERVNFELLFPRPKLAWQVYVAGADGRRVQDWVYLAADFGGGAWAFTRSDGSLDLVDFRDYRIFAGVERKVRGGLESRLEAGYVFGREIQYKSGLPSHFPTDTVMVRAGLMY